MGKNIALNSSITSYSGNYRVQIHSKRLFDMIKTYSHWNHVVNPKVFRNLRCCYVDALKHFFCSYSTTRQEYILVLNKQKIVVFMIDQRPHSYSINHWPCQVSSFSIALIKFFSKPDFVNLDFLNFSNFTSSHESVPQIFLLQRHPIRIALLSDISNLLLFISQVF